MSQRVSKGLEQLGKLALLVLVAAGVCALAPLLVATDRYLQEVA